MSILSSLLLVKNQVFLCKWQNYCVSYICYELVISLRTVTVSCFLSLLTRNKAIFEIKDVSLGKESAWQCRRHRGSIPESGRSPGVGNGSPLQYSCLKNPMDRGAWRATVHGVTKNQTRLKWLSLRIKSSLLNTSGQNLMVSRGILLLLLLSCFIHVRLCATP